MNVVTGLFAGSNEQDQYRAGKLDCVVGGGRPARLDWKLLLEQQVVEQCQSQGSDLLSRSKLSVKFG